MTSSERGSRTPGRGGLFVLAVVFSGTGFVLGLAYTPATPEPTEPVIETEVAAEPESRPYESKYYQHELGDPTVNEYMQSAFADIVERRDLLMPLQQQETIARLFHGLAIWPHNWYLGIRVQKNPCDLWMMHQLIFEVRPDYIIETGTYRGGSALYMAHMLDGMGLDQSRVITIDIDDQCQEAAKLPLWKSHVEFIHSSSTDPATVASIREQVAGKTVMIALDSDHSRDHVFEELMAYGPLVSVGSYAVVEDTNLDALPITKNYAGPMEAVLAFLKTDLGQDFVQDYTREAMVLTFNPGGWLKRVEGE